MKRSLDEMDPEQAGETGSAAKVMPSGARFGMKFLFSPQEIDCISGVGGSGLTEIEDETGANLVCSQGVYPGTELEELCIYGSSSQVVLAALLEAQARLLDELGGLTSGEEEVIAGEGRIKAIVPTKAAAGMIGKGGENIKNLRAQTGIHVHVESQAIPPSGGELAEQVIAFGGSLTGLQSAVPMLFDHVAPLASEPWFAAWASSSNAGLEVPGLWLELTGKGLGGKGKGKGGGGINGFGRPHQGEVCQFFAKAGWCKFGDACRLIHSSSSLIPPQRAAMHSALIASAPQTGEICQFFVKAGWCKFGDACRHSHNVEGLQGLPMPAARPPPQEPGMGPCQFFLKAGWCKWGDACKHGHSTSSSGRPVLGPPAGPVGSLLPPKGAPSPDEPCQFFAKAGWCKYGDTCRFRHSGLALAAGPPGPAATGSRENCQFFAKAGWCKWGDQCRQVHSGFAGVHGIARDPLPSIPPVGASPPSSGEPCLFFAKSGWCKYGDACKHSHTQADVALVRAVSSDLIDAEPAPLRTGEPCQFFLKTGRCKYGDACKHVHPADAIPTNPQGAPLAPPQSSGEPCQFFVKAGWCKFGDACRHLHVGGPALHEGIIGEPMRPPPASTGELCQFFVKSGWCKYGDACKHLHPEGVVPAKPASVEERPLAPPQSSGEPCKFFVRAGWCKYGDACRHLHVTSESELDAADAPGVDVDEIPDFMF